MSCKKCKTSKCTCEVNICINPLIYMMKSVLSLVGTVSSNLIILELLAKMSEKRSRVIEKSAAIELPITNTSSEFTLDVPSALVGVLNSGITVSNNKDFCCPDCKNGIYYLGGPEPFSTVLNTIDQSELCCIEHYMSVELWLNVLKDFEANGITTPKCCNTDFSEVMNNWINSSSATSDYFYLDELLQIGLLESSSFNAYSGLGILYDFLQLNHPELTKEDYLNILGVIINLGVVIQCNGCEMVISSADVFVQWYDYINGGSAAVPA